MVQGRIETSAPGIIFPNRLLEFMNSLLDFTHEKEGVELKEDFDIDAWTRAAGTDFMQSIVVV